jgi:putative transposase
MRAAQIKLVRGSKCPGYEVGWLAQVAPNWLARQFQHDAPDHAWDTDITYSRRRAACLYVAALLDALTVAVLRIKPKDSVILHSDQDSHFDSDEFNSAVKSINRFLRMPCFRKNDSQRK